MYSVNVPKLRGKMAEKGFNISSLSAELGVTRDTLSGYLNNPSKIPYQKIAIMAEKLCDTPEEREIIFFAQKLS